MKIFFTCRYLALLFILLCTPRLQASEADTVRIRETRVPVLIDRSDNELFYLRIDARHCKTLEEVTVDFGSQVNLNDIAALKLYYAGTEGVQREGKTFYAPAAYLSRNNPLYTRKANPSYSILAATVTSPGKTVTLKAAQPL